MPEWPYWWEWELEMSTHVLRRMRDRAFSETDLRSMLAVATGYRASDVTSRWVAVTDFAGEPWEVVVEPDFSTERLVVVTAYPVQ